jgi:ABC-2 type transport system ATP-binding protein
MDTNSHILQVQGLNIYYGNFHAVRDVSFDVLRGEIFGLLGPNGAGKTSTLSAIEGLLNPQSGSIIVAGNDIRKKPLQAKAAIGVQLQATSFQSELTVIEILQLYAGIYGVAMSREKLFYILKNIKLEEAAGRNSGAIGTATTLSLALPFCMNPSS